MCRSKSRVSEDYAVIVSIDCKAVVLITILD